MMVFKLDAAHEHIALCDLLKLTGVCESGGRAKQLIQSGQVSRNGVIEQRKSAKIRAGETISLGAQRITVQAV